MIDDKDVKKIVTALREVFPTAEMVQKGFDGVDENFKEVNKQLDRIENTLLKQHSEEIENLKKRIHRLEEVLAIK